MDYNMDKYRNNFAKLKDPSEKKSAWCMHGPCVCKIPEHAMVLSFHDSRSVVAWQGEEKAAEERDCKGAERNSAEC